jgi:hypothetical protein
MRRGALLLLPAVLASCGGDGGPAVVTGDVFVVLDTGEEVNASGVPVRLVVDHAPGDTLLARLCGERRDMLAEAGADRETEGGILTWAEDERAELLAGITRAATTTGADAGFRLDSVRPGRYRVWVETRVQDERWGWMEPVELAGGDSVHLALGNHNADDDPFRCQLLLQMEEDAAGG